MIIAQITTQLRIKMISKQFRIVNAVLAVIGIAAFIFFQYQMRQDKLGGFKEGTKEYYGYQYAHDNNLKNVDQCADEKDDPKMNINEAFIKGCRAYFKK
jgi:hypothetical protein